MKKFQIIALTGVLLLIANPALAAKLGNQVGAEQDQERAGAAAEVSGDGIPNKIQDEVDGGYSAGPQGNPEPMQVMESVGTANQGEIQSVQVREGLRLHQATQADVDRIMQQEQERLQTRLQACDSDECDILQEQQQARVAVQAMLVMSSSTGEREQEMHRVMGELQASIDAATVAEKAAKQRSGISRFFFGGDKERAATLERVALENRERVQEMQQLVNSCEECDEATQSKLQEQLLNVEREQERISAIAAAEKNQRGLFGWLFGWLD
jgi:hypothetical protein